MYIAISPRHSSGMDPVDELHISIYVIDTTSVNSAMLVNNAILGDRQFLTWRTFVFWMPVGPRSRLYPPLAGGPLMTRHPNASILKRSNHCSPIAIPRMLGLKWRVMSDRVSPMASTRACRLRRIIGTNTSTRQQRYRYSAFPSCCVLGLFLIGATNAD